METSYIENWPGVKKVLGQKLMQNFKEQTAEFGVKFLPDTIEKVDFKKWPFELWTSENIKINALSVIIATGARPQGLNIPGEKKYWGKGVTTCAVCDAPFFKGKDVIIVGGGDSAIEQVFQLSPFVKTIKMFVRKDKLRASSLMKDKLKEYPKVEIIYNSEIKEILGNGTVVKEVYCLDNKKQKTFSMPIDGVFLAIGHEPTTQIFRGQVVMNKTGYIDIDCPSQKTSVAGVFAAGEVEDHTYRQAGVATGSGIRAGLDACSFLQSINFSPVEADKLKDHYFRPELFGFKVDSISTMEEFDKEVLKSAIPVVLDFWSLDCPACIQMIPTFESVAKNFVDKVRFLKIDSEKAPELVEKLFILKLPSLVIYDKGKLVARYHGAMTRKELIDFVTDYKLP